MTPQIFYLLAVLSLGGMIFFSFVFAPLVFSKLPGEHAGIFIRAVFPWYYSTLATTTALSAIAGVVAGVADTWIMALIFSGFLFARYLLIPVINRARDLDLSGDEEARRTFRRLHLASVVINTAQIILLAYLSVRFIT